MAESMKKLKKQYFLTVSFTNNLQNNYGSSFRMCRLGSSGLKNGKNKNMKRCLPLIFT